MSDLDALLTALYVKVDDELETRRWMLTDAELVTLAVAQALLGFHDLRIRLASEVEGLKLPRRERDDRFIAVIPEA
ncbi:hypothetical protein ABZ260_35445 [Streptosporangium sp. NPDC006013]|uniref:hypothetical protein n=1 Tax=Streptosporangium sp. NPDC006013 TaxID=3155596 RepID=UPI0033AEAEAE